MKTVEELKRILLEHSKDFGISLNPPATVQEIEELENVLVRKLPPDLINFYLLCNGFETEDFIFRTIPINEIIEYKHELESSTFYFAEYMIYSDTWDIRLLENDTYVIINKNHHTESATILTDSIYEFLTKYLKGDGVFGKNGLYSWMEEVQAKNNKIT